jgi:hypothetical protein
MRYHNLPQTCIRITLLAGAVAWVSPSLSRADRQTLRNGDLAARLSSKPEASELWNLTAHFDGGYRLFTWFFITNEGPGKRNAAAIWYLVHPNGRVAEFRNGRQEGRWKLSPDRRQIAVASSSLDLRGPLCRVAIDSTSQRAKINLQFPCELPPRFAASLPSTSTLRTDTLQIATPIDGTIWDDGLPAPVAVRGTAALTRAWMDESLPRIVQRRIEFFADQPEMSFYMTDILAPSGNDRRWLALQRGGTVYESSDFELTLGPSVLSTSDRNYPIPARVLVRDGRMSLDVYPQRLLVRTNPLAEVPQPCRFIYSLKLKPLWVWVDASFHLQLRSGATGTTPPRSVEGRGILAVTFVNPLRQPE